MRPWVKSGLALATNKLLNATISFVVRHLHWRMFGEKGRRGMEDAADSTIERQFATTDRVNCYPGRIRGIFDGKLDIQLHGHIAEEPAFGTDKGNLVIELPGHVIAGADVDIFVGQTFAHHRLDSFGLRNFFRGEPAAIQHVQKISVAAGVQLIGAFELYAAFAEKIDNHPMQNRCAQLRFDVVANHRQIFIGEAFGPDRIAGDEDRDVVDETKSGLERATGVEAGRLFGADRKIIDHEFRAGVFQFVDDLFASGFFFQWQECAQRILIAHVRGKPVEHAAHVHDCASEFDFLAEDLCAIGRREYGFADIKTDFAPIDIERGNDFNVIRPIRADLAMHQPSPRAVGRRAVIKIDSLDERAGAITNSNNGDSYFSHANDKNWAALIK